MQITSVGNKQKLFKSRSKKKGENQPQQLGVKSLYRVTNLKSSSIFSGRVIKGIGVTARYSLWDEEAPRKLADVRLVNVPGSKPAQNLGTVQIVSTLFAMHEPSHCIFPPHTLASENLAAVTSKVLNDMIREGSLDESVENGASSIQEFWKSRISEHLTYSDLPNYKFYSKELIFFEQEVLAGPKDPSSLVMKEFETNLRQLFNERKDLAFSLFEARLNFYTKLLSLGCRFRSLKIGFINLPVYLKLPFSIRFAGMYTNVVPILSAFEIPVSSLGNSFEVYMPHNICQPIMDVADRALSKNRHNLNSVLKIWQSASKYYLKRSAA
jgi:hypothetical protein